MSVELRPVRAFMDASHEDLLARARAFGVDVLAPRKPPESDSEARLEAREGAIRKHRRGPRRRKSGARRVFGRIASARELRGRE